MCADVLCDSTCGEALGVFVYPGAQGVSGVCFVLKDDWIWSSFISHYFPVYKDLQMGSRPPEPRWSLVRMVSFILGHQLPSLTPGGKDSSMPSTFFTDSEDDSRFDILPRAAMIWSSHKEKVDKAVDFVCTWLVCI